MNPGTVSLVWIECIRQELMAINTDLSEMDFRITALRALGPSREEDVYCLQEIFANCEDEWSCWVNEIRTVLIDMKWNGKEFNSSLLQDDNWWQSVEKEFTRLRERPSSISII